MRQTTSESSPTLHERRFLIGVDVHLLLLRRGQVLLVSECTGNHPCDVYRTPSGRVEEGESVIDALIRASKEEIGVTVNQEVVSVAHVAHRASGEGPISLFFTAFQWDG
jgi:8-oxo-dGTP diphosphatase